MGVSITTNLSFMGSSVMEGSQVSLTVAMHDSRDTPVMDGTSQYASSASFVWQFSNDDEQTWTQVYSQSVSYNASGNASSTYSFTARPANTGKYRCRIYTEYGNILTSSSYPLKVSIAFRVTEQPTSVTVNQGNAASFHIGTTWDGDENTLARVWQIGGDDDGWATILGEMGATLTIGPGNTYYRDDQFRCKIYEGVSENENNLLAISDTATLSIYMPVAITGDPVSQLAAAGAGVSFLVHATGTDRLYQWQVSTDSGTTWSDISGATYQDLYLTASAAMNGNQYRCVVRNDTSTKTSSAAVLSVVTKLFGIALHPDDQAATAGSTAVFHVTAWSYGGYDLSNLSYQWQKRDAGTVTWTDISGATSSSLSIQASAGMDWNSYRCIVSGPVPELNNGNYTHSIESKDALLRIFQSVPSITRQPQDQTVYAYDSVRVSLAASGTGLQYQWQVRVPNGASETIRAWHDVPESAAAFTTQPGSSENEIQYRCIVTNLLGAWVYSNAATITVVPVKITEHPADLAVRAGGSASFRVTARGENLVYQWYVKSSGSGVWSAISGETDASYSMSAAAADDGKKYKCAVSGGVQGNYISVDSGEATLTVLTPPSVGTQPQNVVIVYNRTAQFSVSATGGNLDYQWQSRAGADGEWANISGGTEATLSFKATGNLDGTQYRCIVHNSEGTATSQAATLTVVTPPVIGTNPQNASVFTGETASFSVTASGYGIHYLWQYRMNSTDTWNSTGYTTASISIQTNGSLNGYQYRCAVYNDAGTVYSTAATLTVAMVKITSHPAANTKSAGDTAAFSVAALGENLSYQWETKAGSSDAWSSISGATGASYSMTATAGDDGRIYRCAVSGGSGGNRSTVRSEYAPLTVIYPAVITRQPQSISVTEGGMAVFRVEANGHYLTFQWQKLNGSAWEDISGEVSGGAVNSNDAVYSVLAEEALEGAQFRCKITTSDAEQSPVYSSAATLSVTLYPEFTRDPQSIRTLTGTEISFTAAALPEGVALQWQRSTDSGTTWSNISGETGTSLTFTAERSMSGYQYCCLATNTASTERSGIATLTVLNGPSITSEPEDAEVGENDSVSFAVTATGDELSYQWQERESEQGEWVNSTRAGATTREMVITVSAQDNGKRFRCVVSNDVGCSVSSREATLSVMADVHITVQPQSAQATHGTMHTFTVTATGGGLGYVWRERGSASQSWESASGEGADTASLTVNAASGMNGFQYQCIVSNPFSSEESNIVTLTVVQGPVIGIHPRSTMAEQGRTARFFVTAYGDNLRYRWQTKASGDSAWSDMGTEDAASYQISVAATAENNGTQYRCVVSNDYGDAVSKEGTLYVEIVKFHLADEEDGLFPNVLPQGNYIFALNASGNGAVYSLGFGTAGDTSWVCEDTSENCAFTSDGVTPLRIVIRGTGGCAVRPMLEAGNTAGGWISPTEREHDAANDFNYDWFSIGNRFESGENVVVARLPCSVTIRYRPFRKDGI